MDRLPLTFNRLTPTGVQIQIVADKSINSTTSSQPAYPPARTLAVTGHRSLKDSRSIAATLHQLLHEQAGCLPTNPGQQNALVLLSPLAEGADRLAAHEILRIPGAELQAVLPLHQADYETDFATAESRSEFRDLLARAVSVEVIPPHSSRAEAYMAVGCRIVEACDILLAVWDGQPGRGLGGTADVVAYARKVGKPVIIIDSENPTKIIRERFPDPGKG